MGLFKKKQTFALSDILKGVQYAINSAQEMLHAQQVQNLMKFWQSNDGSPVTQKVLIGERELDVPLLTLVPHSHMEMDDVEIKFKAKVGDVVSQSMVNGLNGDDILGHTDLKMEMEGVRATDSDVMEITIRFKDKETPEGVARLTDEYNKQI